MSPDGRKKIDPEDILPEKYMVVRMCGMGAWGEVYQVIDTEREKLTRRLGKEFDYNRAVKIINPTALAEQQAEHREVSLEEAVLNEDLRFKSLTNVVPRVLEKSKDGDSYFILMPYYRYFLDDVIEREGGKCWKNKKLPIKQITKWARELANGLYETHEVVKRVHGDLKAANIAVDPEEHYNLPSGNFDGFDSNDGRLLISDFGTGLFASYGWTASPRDNMGSEYSRAPENFVQGSHPTKSSDIWSLGTIIYELFAGEAPFKKEIDEVVNRDGQDHREGLEELFRDLSKDSKGNKILRKRIRQNVHPDFRELVSKALSFESYKRHGNSLEFRKDLESVIEHRDIKRLMKKAMVNALPFWGVPLVALSLIAVSTYFSGPNILPSVEIPPYVISQVDENDVVFTTNIGLQEVNPIDISDHEHKLVGIPIVRNLSFAYYEAFVRMEKVRVDDTCEFSETTDGMRYHYGAYCAVNQGHGSDYTYVVSIAIGSSILPNQNPITGKIDLANFAVYSRLGPQKIREYIARAEIDLANGVISGSPNDYKNYSKYIPPLEKRFIELWMAHIAQLKDNKIEK